MLKFARFLVVALPFGVVLGLLVIHGNQNAYSPLEAGRVVLATMFALTVSAAAYSSGLPDVPKTRRSGALSAANAVLAAALTFSLAQLFVGGQLLPRFVILGSSVILIPLLASTAAISSGGLARAQRRDRVLVVADLDEPKDLLDELMVSSDMPAQIVRVLSIEDVFGGQTSTATSESGDERGGAAGARGLLTASRESVDVTEPHVDPLETLTDKMRGAGANILVLSRRAQIEDEILAQAADVHGSGLRVRTMLAFYEEWLQKLPVSDLERALLFFDIREVHGVRYRRLKRVLDVVAGCIGLPLLVLVFPLVLLGNAVSNRGRPLYRQRRVGKGGKEFTILKFRTMSDVGGDLDIVSQWTGTEDGRITGFGKFLRRSHLDELPQVINLLRGDISVVGPRPEQPGYVEQLSKALPYYQYRHMVRPGLTGWAQVNYGYASNEAGALQKLQFEFYYLRKQSLWLDFRIIGRTVRSVIKGSGR